jgi:hypothetical protein
MADRLGFKYKSDCPTIFEMQYLTIIEAEFAKLENESRGKRR